MKKLLFLLLFLPIVTLAQQPTFKKGIPDDLDKEKIIFLEHEPIKLSQFKEKTKSTKYILQRQENHNNVLIESK